MSRVLRFFLAVASLVVAALSLDFVHSEVLQPVPRDKQDAGPSANAVVFAKTITPLLIKYCYECHGNGKHRADVSLDRYKTLDDVAKGKKTWEAVLHNVRTHEMPPEEKPQPTLAERDLITAWIEKELYQYDPNNPDPGRVTLRRLNKSEYNNTMRDLVGVDFHPADDFPADDTSFGFDTIGDALSLPPVLMEKYFAAATQVLNRAIATEAIPSEVRHFSANLIETGFNAEGDRGDGWVQLNSLEEDEVAVRIPVDAGDYLFRVQAFAKARGKVPMKLSLMIGNVLVKEFEVTAVENKPDIYEARVGVPPGRHRFSALVRRIRGGDNEVIIDNGRVGKKQSGAVFVKYLELEGPLPCSALRFQGDKLEATGQAKNAGGAWHFDKEGEVGVHFKVPKEGEYLLRAQAYAYQSGPEFTKMAFRLDGQAIKTFDVTAPGTFKPSEKQRIFSSVLLEPVPHVYEFRLNLMPGAQHFTAAFLNPYADPGHANPNLRKRGLVIDNLEIIGLSEAPPVPPIPEPLKRLFTKEPTAANKADVARGIINAFARSAWRRPPQPKELDKLADLFNIADKEGVNFHVALKLPLKAVLVSPYFLFRGEIQPEPDNPKAVHPINEFALASRLAYFLWSSTPDDELLDLAERNLLRPNLEAQVKRLLASPKSQALVDNFAGQWLQIRNISLKSLAPDRKLFPDFDENLRFAMRKETELFFEHIVRADRSVFDFLNADYTFVNERLAKHYGIANVKGDDFQKVSLKGTNRAGVLTQASVLTLTSNPTRTSPVQRGKWVLENLLATPPPPPPADVPELTADGKVVTGTLRQQMEKHRQDPNCAACHARMDPLGFGLENFDAIGAWRTTDAGATVDASGQLVSGEKFQGAEELANILVTHKRDAFVRCLSEKMLTYALGRGMEYYDRAATERIAQGLAKNDHRFSALVLEVVKSFPFQMRRGDSSANESKQP